MRTRILGIAISLGILAALTWGALRLVRTMAAPSTSELPTTRVRRGAVVVAVLARGQLQGGNSETIEVPMTGVDSTGISYLREPGELVKEGDIVAQFDITQQEFNLREAQADLAEAEQQVIQAKATSDATDEENRYALLSAQSDVTLAELAIRSNPVSATMKARQNDIALEAARGRLRQAQHNMANKNANSVATVAIQEANLNKAKVQAEMAAKIIESMTIKAKTNGYVSIEPNTNVNIWYTGMTFQPLQIGDTVYSGQAVARIPDFKNWEVSARVGELDRGHLAVGQKVTVSVVALPGKSFTGNVKVLGGTSGPPWDRRFDCRIGLDAPVPEMRPGMTSNLTITAEVLDNVIWIPSQALYESDGKSFAYLRTPQGFMPHDVTLVNRSESQAVIKGLNEGDVVAMSNPEQRNKPASGPDTGAMKALQK